MSVAARTIRMTATASPVREANRDWASCPRCGRVRRVRGKTARSEGNPLGLCVDCLWVDPTFGLGVPAHA